MRLYDHLFTSERPDDDDDFMTTLNPESLETVRNAKVEPSLADAVPGEKYQFERTGYFAVDPDSQPGALVFNRTVTLRELMEEGRCEAVKEEDFVIPAKAGIHFTKSLHRTSLTTSDYPSQST